MELQLVNRSGQLRHVLVSMTMIELNGKKCMISTLLDITERKRVETALRESEQRYRALAEAAHDMIFMIDRDDHITYVNSFASEQLERPPEALVGQPRSSWFGKSDTDRIFQHLEQVFETDKPHYAESEVIFSRGTVYLSTWLIPLRDESGVVTQVLGVSRDITGLKKLERSLKKTNLQLEARVEKRTAELRDSRDRLRELTQQIVSAQEEERRRISRELHDEAGQALIGLRFSLDAVYRELPANPRKIRQRMVKALAQTDQTIQRIRALTYNLRPPTLDLLGVNLGIKELCREFSERTGLKVKYAGVDLEGLQDDISIGIYRFVQEALTNVAKHALASKVQVILQYQDEMIKATVQDNGRGIPDEKRFSGLGMVGIKERFDALGGQLEVTSIIPKGTQVQVSLPWECTADVPHRPEG
jgi:PAS domain S-box-containing protein